MAIVIELEIEESVLEDIDELSATLGISRTVYIMAAVKHALHHHRPKDLSAGDEANTFRLWLAGDDEQPNGFQPPEWPPDDGRLN